MSKLSRGSMDMFQLLFLSSSVGDAINIIVRFY